MRWSDGTVCDGATRTRADRACATGLSGTAAPVAPRTALRRIARRRSRYNSPVNADDVRRFAQRDWAMAATSKADYWAQQHQQHGAIPARRAATALLEHMRVVRPDYPSVTHRDEDLATHRRLRQCLDLAAHAFTRR